MFVKAFISVSLIRSFINTRRSLFIFDAESERLNRHDSIRDDPYGRRRRKDHAHWDAVDGKCQEAFGSDAKRTLQSST